MRSGVFLRLSALRRLPLGPPALPCSDAERFCSWEKYLPAQSAGKRKCFLSGSVLTSQPWKYKMGMNLRSLYQSIGEGGDYVQMKIGVEQSLFVVMFLAQQPQGSWVKGRELSRILDVSDSYLKKITRKLVQAGIVRAEVGKSGGLCLGREPEKISFLHIFNAIEGAGPFLVSHNLRDRVSAEKREAFEQKADLALSVFRQAQEAYQKDLASCTIADLLNAHPPGQADWERVSS